MKYVMFLAAFLVSCSATSPSEQVNSDPLNPNFNDYWYNNEAEISSYELSQARYGELREGSAVLIFVTEGHSPSLGTKPDQYVKDEIPVLKLNFTKNFNTGIYPYSMMNSTFYPISKGNHSLKISSSSQEWCGHTYVEMKNQKQYEVVVNSYFEGESKKFSLTKNILEDDIMSMIRVRPNDLPIGKHLVIPTFFALRFLHQPMKAYECEISINENGESNIYTLHYPTLERTMKINFEKEFPHRILGWEETQYSGFGAKKKEMTSTARIIKTIKSTYWRKNSNADEDLRDELGLK